MKEGRARGRSGKGKIEDSQGAKGEKTGQLTNALQNDLNDLDSLGILLLERYGDERAEESELSPRLEAEEVEERVEVLEAAGGRGSVAFK